jgi:hypothetical protein
MKRLFGAFSVALAGWLAMSSQVLAAFDNGFAVPEIDATGALTGLAVLGGLLALVAERKRQK